jgi:hypothetical protein
MPRMSTLGASAQMAQHGERTALRSLTLTVLPAATAIVLLALSLLPLFLPPWVHFAMDTSGGSAWTDSPAIAHALSDRTIGELLLGPATFAIAGPDGAALYTADEAAHLRDVRLVLYAFLAIALASALLVGWALMRRGQEPATWHALARGGAILAVGLVVAGVVAALAFATAFELFHRLLFPGGNWEFPVTSGLIRLYPYGFWQLSAAALATLGLTGGVLSWWLAHRRARALEAAR